EHLERAEYRAHVGGAEAVDLADAEIGRDRVDYDHLDVADLDDLLPQRGQVGDQAEHALFARLVQHLNDVYALAIGASRLQSRDGGVVDVVLGGQQDHVAGRGESFAAGPLAAGVGDPRDDVGQKHALTFVWHAGDEPDLLQCETAGPHPINGHHLFVRRAHALQRGELRRLLGAREQIVARLAGLEPVRHVAARRHLAEGDHANVGNDAAQLARDLGGVLVSGRVVILVDVGAHKSGEPFVQVRRPLAGAAGISGGDQAELGEIVGVLLALAYLNGRVLRYGLPLRLR